MKTDKKTSKLFKLFRERSLAEPESQTDPKFQTLFKYTRITPKAMREALITEKGWADENLPCVRKKVQNANNPRKIS